MAKTTLFLHYYPRVAPRSDFEEIAARIHGRTSDISVKVLATDRPHPSSVLQAAMRPAISVEFNRAKMFPLLRGWAFRQWRKSAKSTQYRALDRSGVPVPKWAMIAPDTDYDPAEWGEHVIEKPDRGGKGAYVRIKRTKRIRYRDADALEEDNPGRNGGMLIQRLVCTGDWPVSYRVTTLFGTPLIALRYEGVRGRLYQDAISDKRKLVGPAAVATGKGAKITTDQDAEILDLARRTHQALPGVPVLGTDIVRDVTDGSLWVLEVNPDGNCWPFGSPPGIELMASTGIDLYAQLNGLDRAADALIDVCRKTALKQQPDREAARQVQAQRQ